MADTVEAAANWLADQKEVPQQAFNLLREKFSLTAVQAARALTLANEYRRVKR